MSYHFKRYSQEMCAYHLTRKEPRTLDPHHIIRKADRPDLMFVVDNGVTLCRPCHRMTLNKEKEFAQRFIDYINSLKGVVA